MSRREVTIPLDISDIKILKTEINSQGELVITIESTKPDTRCQRCGRSITKFHGHDEWVTIRYLPVFGRPSYLRYRPRRYYCGDCEVTTTQRVDWHEPNSPHSMAYDDYVMSLVSAKSG